jgi:putative spermidine/putrescine transport system permease protein
MDTRRLLMKLWKSLVALVMALLHPQCRAHGGRGRHQLGGPPLARHLAARRLHVQLVPDGLEGVPARQRAVGHDEVVAAVVFLSILIGVPAAYALARRNFRGKRC